MRTVTRWVVFVEGFDGLLDAVRVKASDRRAFDANQMALLKALSARSDRDVAELSARDDERRQADVDRLAGGSELQYRGLFLSGALERHEILGEPLPDRTFTQIEVDELAFERYVRPLLR